MAKKELIPPDLKQCQAEVPNGYNFMTLGGRPGRQRCKNKPLVIATETKADSVGRKGSMSLCGHCMEVMQDQLGPGFAKFKQIIDL